MEKYQQVTQTQTVDLSTGEIVQYDTTKTYTRKIESESFYMTFIDYIAPLYNLKSDAAKNVLNWMCCHAEYNTGKVQLTTNQRDIACEELGMKSNSLSNHLKKLKDLKLIEGERGDFIINPQIFWKGDTATRDKMLRDNEIKIIFKLEEK